MTARAWPYAVSRGATAGYQAIVVPGFLADAEQAYILEYASRQETSEPGVVTVRDVLGAIEEPLSLAYRVLEVRADRYGLGGTDPLEDRAGRAIRAFEGLVLPLPAERVPSIGLTAADLEAVTVATAPAFRKLWEAGSRIEPEASAALSVGGTTGESPLSLRISEPYVVPGTSAKRRPAPPKPRPAPERPPARPEKTRSAAERPPARPRRTGLTIGVAAACVLSVLLAWFLFFKAPPRSAEATARDLCSDLSKGDASGAYQLSSAGYQHRTSLPTFKKMLLGSNPSGTCSPTMIAYNQAAVSVRRLDGTTQKATLGLGQPAGQWQIISMQLNS